MKYKMLALCLVLTLIVVGCAAKSEQSAMPSSAPIMQDERAYDKAAGSTSSTGGGANTAAWVGETQTKMIVYTADLALVVKDSGVAQEDITRMIEGVGGYVSNSSSYTYSGGLRRITLTLRLPADKFNETMTALRDMAMEVTQENIGTQDVTQEYVDLESRLRALEAKATRLEELMEKAEDTEAVLAVYEQLSQTQVDIEQTKGRMQYLERSAAMATITVTLTPDALSQPLEIAGWRPSGIAKTAFEALVRVFQGLIGALIWIIILIIPVLLFLGGLLFLFTRALRLIFGRRKRAPKTPPTPGAGG